MIDDALLPGCGPHHLSGRTKPAFCHGYEEQTNFDVFLTNDHRLNRFTSITIEVI
jgi:hypothetical protein